MSRRTFKALRCHRAQCGGTHKKKEGKKSKSKKINTFLKKQVQWLNKHKVSVGIVLSALVAAGVATSGNIGSAAPAIPIGSKVYVWIPTHHQGFYWWIPAKVQNCEPPPPTFQKEKKFGLKWYTLSHDNGEWPFDPIDRIHYASCDKDNIKAFLLPTETPLEHEPKTEECKYPYSRVRQCLLPTIIPHGASFPHHEGTVLE